LNPVLERATFTSRATKTSGNDWMGMLMLHLDDTSFAGISWGVDASSGGETDAISMVAWTPSGHTYRKSATLDPGTMYEFKLDIEPPGTLTGHYRQASTEPWTLIDSVDYPVNGTHSVLVGRPVGLGGGSAQGYSSRMLVDWLRQEPRLLGTYLSPIRDIGCPSGIISRVSWGPAVVAGGSVRLFLCSADDPAHVATAPWTEAINSAYITAPCDRFIQLRAVLARGSSSVDVTLSDVDLVYSGVRQVRVSTDGIDWTVASGTVAWSATLDLKEGPNRIFVEATDCTGGRATSSVNVTVDTLPPEGDVLINGGAEYTNGTGVRLALTAHDATGVTEMMVSDTEDFAAARWVPYATALDWPLPPGDGMRTVSVVFRDGLGHLSSPSRDSIILDTTPPTTEVAINGGDPLTRWPNITVAISVTERYGTDAVQLSQDPVFGDAAWQPLQPYLGVTLTPGEGPRKVYARARDAAGNVGPAGDASITLDTVAPVSSMEVLPAEMPDKAFTVRWSGTDATSGVLRYDVQHREGTGAWTDWLSGTTALSALFTGQLDHAYSFRVRAQDRAGNLEPFPEEAQLSLHVRPPRAPVVAILQPWANDTVVGSYYIFGTSFHPEPGFGVVMVEVRLDGGEWTPASGTLVWNHTLDTGTVANGPHVVSARAYDGERYSSVTQAPFVVKNAPPPEPVRNPQEPMWPILVVIIVVAVVIIVVVAHWLGRRATGADAHEDRPT
jgi:hypothetical protein